MTALSHAEARPIILDAIVKATGRDLPLASVDLVQGVNSYETGYGAWANASACPGASDAHNWGAMQVQGAPHWPAKPSGDPCSPAGFLCSDRDAAGVVYWTCFRRFASDADGAAAMVGLLWRKPKVKAYLLGGDGDPYAMARAMRAERYFEQDAAVYGKNLAAVVKRVRAGIGAAAPSRVGPAVVGGVALVVAAVATWRLA